MIRKISTAIKIILHSLLLSSVNLFSAAFIVAVFLFFGLDTDPIYTWTFSFLSAVIIYTLIFIITARQGYDLMFVRNQIALIIVLLMSILLVPVIFIVVRFLAVGQWHAMGAFWSNILFYVLVNGVCLLLNISLQKLSLIKNQSN